MGSDEDRRTLLNYYNSKVNNHVGYIISDMVSYVGLLNIHILRDLLPNREGTFSLTIIFLGLSFYLYVRSRYWSACVESIIKIGEPTSLLNDLHYSVKKRCK